MEPIRELDAQLREVFAEYEIIDAHVHPPTPLPNTDFSLFKQISFRNADYHLWRTVD